MPGRVPPPSAPGTDLAPPSSGGGDGGSGDGPVDGPVQKDLDRDDAVARLGATGGDAAIEAGGHVDAARQRAASAVRSFTVEVAAAAAACEAAGDAEPVGPFRDASTLLTKLRSANSLLARGTTSYESAALGDAESASTAVLRAVDAVTVPTHRTPAAVSGGDGAADAAASAVTAAEISAVVACRRLCARTRHAAGSVFSAAKGLIPMATSDAGDHPGNDAGSGAGSALASVGGGTRGRLRHCGSCGVTGHDMKMCSADAAAKAAHGARVGADVAAKGARASSSRGRQTICPRQGARRRRRAFARRQGPPPLWQALLRGQPRSQSWRRRRRSICASSPLPWTARCGTFSSA